MSGSTERVIGKTIKYGAVFAEVGSLIWDPPKIVDAL